LEIIKPVSFFRQIKELTVVEVIAKLQVINPFDYFVEEYAENFLSHTTNASARIDCLSKFKRRKSYFPKIHGGSKTKPINTTNDFLVSINQAVYKELSYNLRMEVGVQTPEETLRIKSGSCRDFALIHVLRHFGLAARFVSGYIVQLSRR
jgi:transglutaminase-like putative cysteine protease